MIVSITITVWCEAISPGCTFYARITDAATSSFYGGSGATALEAAAWALDEYVRRGMFGRNPSPARNADARPGDTW